jgi:hypothetical protein
VRAVCARLRWADLAHLAGAVLVVVVVWCLAYGRMSREAWTTPISYRGDALFLLSYLKAASDGHVFPGASLSVPELNAPFEANWNDHPRTLRAVFLLAGALSRWSGLFFAANLLLLLAHVLAAVSFYVVARHFGTRREWASAGAIVFGLAHYFFWRSLDHLDLTFAWHLPLCVLVVTWAFGRRGIEPFGRRFWVGVTITVVTALQNPYYMVLYVQFLLLASLAQMVGGGWRRVLGPLALVLVCSSAFALDDAGTLAYEWREGWSPGAVRPYGNLERFALKPIELAIPAPGFGIADWGRLALTHWSGRLYRGEGGSPYLGLVGLAALLWLAGLGARRLLERPPQPPPAALLAVAWVVLFSIVGGLNVIPRLFGLLWLRATNRYSVWILVLVLLFFVTRCSRLCSRRWSVALAFAVTALAIADQVPTSRDRKETRRTQLEVETDRLFARGLDEQLPRGAMLFMLPVTDFPEGRPVGGAMEYDHLRPYLFSEHLRFSFGSDRGRPREGWQKRMEQLEPPAMAAELERFGFTGIVLNRKAYPHSGVDLISWLEASGRVLSLTDMANRFALIRLRPIAAPELPGPPPFRTGLAPDETRPLPGAARAAATAGGS